MTQISTRMRELKAKTLSAVRVENRPTDYIEAQAHEDGYSMAVTDFAPMFTKARQTANHLMHIVHSTNLSKVERQDGHRFAVDLLSDLAVLEALNDL